MKLASNRRGRLLLLGSLVLLLAEWCWLGLPRYEGSIEVPAASCVVFD